MNNQIDFNQPVLIGLSGLARSGKTTTAETIVSYLNTKGYSCSLVSMADPIKSALSKLNVFKHIDADLYRTLAQHIGDKCREVNPNWFVNIFKDTLEVKKRNSSLLGQKAIYVCDDIRFENELINSNIFNNPIISIYVSRPSLDLSLPVYKHLSEKFALDHLSNPNPLINFTINNDVELNEYKNQVVIPLVNSLGFIDADRNYS